MSSRISLGAGSLRLPRNYQAILEAVWDLDAGMHASAQELCIHVRRTRPAIGFATVHRGLARLHALGCVNKLDVPGAAAVYERATPPHAHFRCSTCGGIQDVDFTVSGEQIAALSRSLGFQIAAESTTFAGRCATCIAAAGD